MDANDAFLRMIEYTRDELRHGLIDWRDLTPPEFNERDQKAIEQLRDFGVAVPYEKAFVLRDGKRVDFLTDSVRLFRPSLHVGFVHDRRERNEPPSRNQA